MSPRPSSVPLSSEARLFPSSGELEEVFHSFSVQLRFHSLKRFSLSFLQHPPTGSRKIVCGTHVFSNFCTHAFCYCSVRALFSCKWMFSIWFTMMAVLYNKSIVWSDILWKHLLYFLSSPSGHLKVERRSTLKLAAMVLILGRRMIREEPGIRDSPAVKRKVLWNKRFYRLLSFKSHIFAHLYTCCRFFRSLRLIPRL